MSQPARTTVPRTTRTTARTATRTTARTATARTGARTGARAATGPVHAPRTSPGRRTGPVAPGPQLRLVPPARTTPTRVPARSRSTARRRAPFVALVVGLLVATTLGLLLLNTAIAVDSLDASQQRQVNAEQAKQVARLQQRVVAADTAPELARAAAADGLVPAGAAAHLVLQPDGTSVLLGTATPAAAGVQPGPAPTNAPAKPVPPTAGN
jgi:hypothetical protein